MSAANSLATLFGWSARSSQSTVLPDVFPISIQLNEFVMIDVETLFVKILTDVVERVQGLPEKSVSILWDNCLGSESNKGLISLLANAITHKKELYIVYKKDLGTIREADNNEAQQIKADYKAKGASALGIFISFKEYKKIDMIKLYSSLEYCTVSALNKSMNLSKAVQYKMSDMRKSVNLIDKSGVESQAVAIATALAAGQDVLLDADDSIETAIPDVAAIEATMSFLDGKRAFYLGLPVSYINGHLKQGIGDTGEADTKATERGLKNFYFAIVKPVCDLLFGVSTKYKSQDFRQMGSALEALKTFSLTDESLIAAEDKKLIIQRLFDISSEDAAETKEAIEQKPNTNPQQPVDR